MVVLSHHNSLTPADLPEKYNRERVKDYIEIPRGTLWSNAEKKIILHTLKDQGGNHTRAADALGIGQRTLTRKLQEAEEDKRLAAAMYEVQIAQQDKEQVIRAATAEAESIRIKAEAQAEAYRVIAEHIGKGNAALVELLKIVGEAGINITPRVMVIGQNGGGSGQSAETTALIGTMLDSMMSKQETGKN